MTATLTRTLLQITVAGSPRERGRQQGEGLREVIASAIERWQDGLGRRHRVAADAYIAEFLAKTSFVPAIERYTPGLLDEVRGIANGCGLPFETVLAYNLMDEEWTFGRQRLGESPGCTVACLAGDGPPVIAQTMDIPSVHDGSQVVVHHTQDSGPEALVFTGAGMIALNGANSAGVGVVVNNLSMLPSSRSGLPVMFMIRGILERSTLRDAVAFVSESSHAIGQHYAIGAPDGIASLEGAAHGVVAGDVSAGRYTHTNHPTAAGNLGQDADHDYRESTTFVRQQRAQELIGGAADQAGIEALLSDVTAPISCGIQYGSMTFGGTSIACSVPPVMHVTAGPPHETEWTPVGF